MQIAIIGAIMFVVVTFLGLIGEAIFKQRGKP
jgi:hypothetical protein